MTELSADSTEHEMVIAALQPMDPGRKCFRLIGDVLVERTVGETLPAVEKTRANLDLMIASLQTQLQQVSVKKTWTPRLKSIRSGRSAKMSGPVGNVQQKHNVYVWCGWCVGLFMSFNVVDAGCV